ncbi:MAG TPA: sigma-70 family RNA polymerase sigma factor [Ktedonobacteraceae bacterium]|jgi:RNA polymerase sigma factor (sigma-70 family)|nr:sigma-70 family RNA polymerase sigma factor [Ktedonobacteraceae bacterium]
MQNFSDADIREEPSDEALLNAIAGGATWAMESLYQRYSRILYSLAYRMVADHQVAEDLLQDAFIAVWKRATSFSPQAGGARSWLISILHHRTIDYLRKVRRRSVLHESPLQEVEVEETIVFPDVWDEAWRNVQGSQIRAALMKIAPEQRLVIELAYFQGWTHAEIAEGTQVPLGTVKARMRLGLHHLKRILQKMGIDEV